MNILYRIAYSLSSHPKLKKYLKDIYQFIGNAISDKESTANIKLLTDPDYEHMFGYYDKSPYSFDDKKIIFLRVSDAYKEVAPLKEAQIILKDLETGLEKVISNTTAWNIQQGNMLQWLDTNEIIYNDFIDNDFRSIILDLNSMEKKVLNMPVYSVNIKNKIALSLDFSRLHLLRPGYGYSNKKAANMADLKDNTIGCIWHIDLLTGNITELLRFEDILKIDFHDSMKDALHKVNHIMINPSGTRFMFLHRWIKKGIKKTRLMTCNIDGTNIVNLLDEDMVSHCTWKDDKTILGWAHTHELGNHYYYIHDICKEVEPVAKEKLLSDGHPSFSPNGRYFITDTYPDFKRKQHLYLYDTNTHNVVKLASIYSNYKYKNEYRCDLHPRWNRKGNKICFDSAAGENRGVYEVSLEGVK